MTRETIDCSLVVHKLLEHSILVSEMGKIGPDGNVLDGVFLPLSKIAIDEKDQQKLDKWDAAGGPLFTKEPLILTIGVPEWLAMKEGLI